jgi:type VII secretion protein EccB
VQSRRDQVQAQSYVLGRLASALVSAEPDAMETPHRRTVAGVLCGILVAGLVVAGFAVYGFLVPGAATKWRQAGVLIVERETGSRYLLAAGRLRPVLNYASARLLLGTRPKVVSVSAASLRGVPHGQPLGIVGAPDVLPAVSALRDTVWSACAAAATTLAVRRAAEPAPATLPPGQAIVVRANGQEYLLWNGRRFRLAAPWLAKIFGYAGSAVTVAPGWLDLLPSGVDIAPIPVPGRGEAGPAIDGRPTRIGQLFAVRVDGGPERHYLLQRDGLSQLTATGYAIASGDPDAAGDPPRQISLGALARLPVAGGPVPGAGAPPTPPVLARAGGGQTWCVRTPVGGAPGLSADHPVGADGTVHTGPGVIRTDRTAGAVEVAPGAGGLAVAGTVLYLVTDAGLKYPVAGAAVAATLGYPLQSATVLEPGLLDLLPTGPLLDPRMAGA